MANHRIKPRIVAMVAIPKANNIGAILQTKRETSTSGGRITKRIRGAAMRLLRMRVEAVLHPPTSRIETATEQITTIIETMLAPNLNTKREETIATELTIPIP